MNKLLRALLAIVCLAGLVYVRFRESELFYDPLIAYFQGDYQNTPLPELAEGKFILNVVYRYLLNMILSFGLLWAAFLDKQIMKFASLFYGVVLIVLIVVLYILLQKYDPAFYLPLFYVRRFLIQPLLIFLLLPAFFYSRKVNN